MWLQSLPRKSVSRNLSSVDFVGLIWLEAMSPKPQFFPTPADFRARLEAHHDKFQELFVGFHKKDSGKPSITWPESVEVALCFGWIDGVRKSLNETSYTIRFTPRKPTSTWSSINVNLVRKLTKKGLMHPAGLKAFAARSTFRSQAPWYQRLTTYWVISAKREETKLKRLSVLIDCSQHRRTLPQLIPAKKK